MNNEVTVEVGAPLVTPEDYAGVWLEQIDQLNGNMPPSLARDTRDQMGNLKRTVLEWPETFRASAQALGASCVWSQRSELSVYLRAPVRTLAVRDDGKLVSEYRNQKLVGGDSLVTQSLFTNDVLDTAATIGVSRAAMLVKKGDTFIVEPIIVEEYDQFKTGVVAAAKRQIEQLKVTKMEACRQSGTPLGDFLLRSCLDGTTQAVNPVFDILYDANYNDVENFKWWADNAAYLLTHARPNHGDLHAFTTGLPGFDDAQTVRAELQQILDAPAKFTDMRQAALATTVRRVIDLIL